VTNNGERRFGNVDTRRETGNQYNSRAKLIFSYPQEGLSRAFSGFNVVGNYAAVGVSPFGAGR
jgi:hypothetical protein